MTTMRPPSYGDPFLVVVTEGHLDGHISSEDLELVRTPVQETDAISYAQSEVGEYGGAQRIYLCIPVARIWTDDPARDETSEEWHPYTTQVERVESDLERMAAAALAMGVNDEGARRANIS